jgi:hypothetical protein
MWVDLALASPLQPSLGRKTAFTSTVDMRPSFFLRERRFRTQDDNQLWDTTRVHELDFSMVRGRQLAKGGAANRYNYWLIHGGVLGSQYDVQSLMQSLGTEPYKPGSAPIVNLVSMEKHGIRPYVITSDYLPLFVKEKDGSTKNVAQLAANWLKRVHDWYGVAPYQLSGTLTTTYLRPDIRVGHRVREERVEGPITYYVEGVQHSWSYPGPGSTTLTVTHGQYDDQDALNLLYEDYDLKQGSGLALSNLVQERGEPQAKGRQKVAPKQGETVPVKEPATKPGDPSMVGVLGNRNSAQARDIAKGITTDPLPDTERDKTRGRTALDQKNLEDGQKIK